LHAQATAAPAPARTEADATQLAERDRLWEEAQQLLDAGKLVEAAAAGERGLAMNLELLAPDDERIGNAYDWLGGTYEELEDWPQARQQRSDELAWRELRQGKDHWETALARVALDELSFRQQLKREERARLKQAERAGKDFNVAYSERRYADAQKHAEEALAIHKEILGEQRIVYATSLTNLAALYSSMARYEEAEPLLRQAIDVYKTTLGEQHPFYATTMHNLAQLHVNTGKYAEAVPLYKRAIEIRKHALGDKHDDVATGINSLANAYTVMGKYAEAESLYLEALELWKAIRGEKDTQYAASQRNLA
jgi:tetratricopeptide (TPR) repeat protein